MAKESIDLIQPTDSSFLISTTTPSLDPGRRWGYAVFGMIMQGEEVLEAIAKVKTEYNESLSVGKMCH